MQNRNWKLLLLFSLGTPLIFSEEPNVPNANPAIYVTVNNEAHSTVHMNQPKKKIRCSDLLGNNLKECIHATTKRKQKKLLRKISKHHRSAYFKTLTQEEYKTILASFTEAEWKSFLAQLSEYEKKQWPKTIQEQIAQLDEIKKTADKELLTQIAKKAGLDMLLLAPFCPPIAALVMTIDGFQEVNTSIRHEEEAFKKYIAEKFG